MLICFVEVTSVQTSLGSLACLVLLLFCIFCQWNPMTTLTVKPHQIAAFVGRIKSNHSSNRHVCKIKSDQHAWLKSYQKSARSLGNLDILTISYNSIHDKIWSISPCFLVKSHQKSAEKHPKKWRTIQWNQFFGLKSCQGHEGSLKNTNQTPIFCPQFQKLWKFNGSKGKSDEILCWPEIGNFDVFICSVFFSSILSLVFSFFSGLVFSLCFLSVWFPIGFFFSSIYRPQRQKQWKKWLKHI